MNVKELINELKKYDDDTMITTWDCYYDIETNNVHISEMKDNDGKVYLAVLDACI